MSTESTNNVSDSGGAEQEQGDEETHAPEDQPPDAPSFVGPTIPPDENGKIVITSIRGIDLSLGLRRIPAGFYASVHHSNLEWRTENKPVSVNDDVLEWHGPIPIPSDTSASIAVAVYASFEFQPVLGNGEQLRRMTITVDELLDRSTKGLPFIFFPEDGDVVSPCSSLLVMIKPWKCDENGVSAARILEPRRPNTGSGDQLEDATDQGHSALSRYRKKGSEQDLQCAIEYFEHALNICPLDHPCRAVVQSNMALAKLIDCQANHSRATFDIPVALYRNALAARPAGHLDRASTLIQLAAAYLAQLQHRGDSGVTEVEALLHEAMELSSAESHGRRAATFMLQLHGGKAMQADCTHGQSTVGPTSQATDIGPLNFANALLTRFERFGDLADLQQAISILATFIESISPRSPQHLAGLNSLGTALGRRFEWLGELDDLEGAISSFQDVVRFIPDGHPDKPGYLSNLGSSFRTRFECLGDLSDLGEAIARQKEAVRLVPDSHPDKPMHINLLGTSFITRFEHLGEPDDLEEAISSHGDAVRFTPDSHPNKPGYLTSLGTSLETRFDFLGVLNDLEEAISRERDAVRLIPGDHPMRPGCLNNLGTSLHTRFERLGELDDLEEAISKHQDAVFLTPDDHPMKPGYLGNLGTSFSTRFERLGDPNDLEEAILKQRDVVHLTPDDHPNKAGYLSNLGTSLRIRFERLGNLSDIGEAISRQQDVVRLTPDGHPMKPGYLNHLGISLRIRFERLGDQSDIEEAISKLLDAVHYTPDGHPDKCTRLNSLGISLVTRFEHLGDLNDLEDGILRQLDAVNLTPDGDPDKSSYLNSLSSSFIARFSRLGDLGDLGEAISRLQNTIRLTPDGHPAMCSRLNNLGISFVIRFHHLGELGDLEEAVLKLRNAVHLAPNDHPDKAGYLVNLGTSFHSRFEHLGELSDIEEAISRLQDAVCLTPDGHPMKHSCLNNLGTFIRSRFERLGDLTDLEEAISRLQDAVHLVPDAHPNKPAYLNNLGYTFCIRFKCLGDPGDLEEAISKLRDAAHLTPDGHPNKPGYLSNLGDPLITRFERLEGLSDLEEAISRLQDAVRLTPDGHYDKCGRLNNLANFFVTRFERFGELRDLQQVLVLSSAAALSSAGDVAIRLRASQNWILSARLLRHHSLLHAHSVSISLLPQLAWIGLSLSHRYQKLFQSADIARQAAAAALDAGHPETAVEWLEQGRSIVWGELLQLRNSYNELSSLYPSHGRQLRDLSAALEGASFAREKLSELFLSSEQATIVDRRESLQQEADRHRQLAIQRDKLLQEIRQLPGFERFLLHKEISQLRASAGSGPVVFLNATETRCDALIVLAEMDQVIHVPLSSFTFQRSKQLRTDLDKFVRQAREGHPVPQGASGCESILAPLWRCVVKPVLDALAFSVPEALPSRIFWCPTGPFTFLPIHAAGFYDSRFSHLGNKVFDFVVSSYTPTLSILASSSPDAAPNGDLHLLAVRQPATDGLRKLPGTNTELEHIKAVIKSFPSAGVTLMESSDGTVEEVLSLMKEADWVHFACHGVQDATNATNSGLCLANERRLRVSDTIGLSRPRGGLAFLSACQTATGDEDLSDEAIHIAAAMLFAGYGGVIGTMWTISDRLAPGLARDVYERLFQNGTRPNHRDAARALHDAVAQLRQDKSVSFKDWLPFIHVGL